MTLFILSLTIFTVIRLTGDPVTLLAEPGARAEDLQRIRVEWGLDRPWPVQYLAFVKNVVTGKLGKSFNYEMPVSTLYFQRLPNSLELALAATLISFFIGIPAGLISAVRVNSAWDNAGKLIALFGLAVPGFWLGLVMILVFSVWLGWLPTSGQGGWRHLIMPALALGWYFAASLLRLTRSSMLEVLRSEYIKLARLKGLPGYVVIAMHAFKNALIPVLTLAGVNLVVMINARGHHRGDLCLAGHRPAALRGHLPARLPAGAGRRHGGRHHDRSDQPDDRHPLRLHRPPHPPDQIGAPNRCAMTFVELSNTGTVLVGGCAAGRCGRSAARGMGYARELPIVPLAILVPFVLIAVFANFIAPYDPTEPIPGAKIFEPPFWMAGANPHALLGTDFQGRDVLSRLDFRRAGVADRRRHWAQSSPAASARRSASCPAISAAGSTR